MLIKVFGIWLMAQNITYMESIGDSCVVNFISRFERQKFYQNCDQVAQEINKQIKELK